MVENDTVKLLRECDGDQMGVAAIDDVMSHVHGEEFRNRLNACRDEHENLRVQVREMLRVRRRRGKEPNPVGEGDVVDQDERDARRGRKRRDGRRSDDGWLQHGREVAQPVSESVRGG